MTLGIVVSTVGFSGIAPMLDAVVSSIEDMTIQTVKPELK